MEESPNRSELSCTPQVAKDTQGTKASNATQAPQIDQTSKVPKRSQKPQAGLSEERLLKFQEIIDRAKSRQRQLNLERNSEEVIKQQIRAAKPIDRRADLLKQHKFATSEWYNGLTESQCSDLAEGHESTRTAVCLLFSLLCMIFAIFGVIGILISEALNFYLREREEVYGLYERTESVLDATLNT